MKVYSTKLRKTLDVYATKADQWCFVRIGQEVTGLHVFFFECGLTLLGKAYFREMNEECPYPPIKVQPPVVEEICYMQSKKANNIISHVLDAYGEGNAEGVIACYVTALTTVKKGDVETMCTKDSVIEGWEQLTGNKLADLIANADEVLDNGENSQIFKQDDVVTDQTFEAK